MGISSLALILLQRKRKEEEEMSNALGACTPSHCQHSLVHVNRVLDWRPEKSLRASTSLNLTNGTHLSSDSERRTHSECHAPCFAPLFFLLRLTKTSAHLFTVPQFVSLLPRFSSSPNSEAKPMIQK